MGVFIVALLVGFASVSVAFADDEDSYTYITVLSAGRLCLSLHSEDVVAGVTDACSPADLDFSLLDEFV
jgi:hypothetical protein